MRGEQLQKTQFSHHLHSLALIFISPLPPLPPFLFTSFFSSPSLTNLPSTSISFAHPHQQWLLLELPPIFHRWLQKSFHEQCEHTLLQVSNHSSRVNQRDHMWRLQFQVRNPGRQLRNWTKYSILEVWICLPITKRVLATTLRTQMEMSCWMCMFISSHFAFDIAGITAY